MYTSVLITHLLLVWTYRHSQVCFWLSIRIADYHVFFWFLFCFVFVLFCFFHLDDFGHYVGTGMFWLILGLVYFSPKQANCGKLKGNLSYCIVLFCFFCCCCCCFLFLFFCFVFFCFLFFLFFVFCFLFFVFVFVLFCFCFVLFLFVCLFVCLFLFFVLFCYVLFLLVSLFVCLFVLHCSSFALTGRAGLLLSDHLKSFRCHCDILTIYMILCVTVFFLSSIGSRLEGEGVMWR